MSSSTRNRSPKRKSGQEKPAPRLFTEKRYSLRELYAAAKVDRLTNPWSPAGTVADRIIGASAPTVRQRVRQLVRDFPPFGRALRTIVNYTVGTGITYQSRVALTSDDGEGGSDVKTNRAIEKTLEYAFEEIDVAGKQHFYGLQGLHKSEEVECGESFAIVRYLDDPGRYLPIAVQLVEPEWLTSYGVKQGGGNVLEGGIEYDRVTGRPVFYHFSDPEFRDRPMRVPAENVLHLYKQSRAGQRRGISALAAAVMVARDCSEYIDAEIDACKMAAKWLAFIETGDPLSRQLSVAKDGTGADEGKKIEELQNAALEYLRPGEKITMHAVNRPGSNFEAFIRFIFRLIAIAGDVSYELVSGDYSGINYSNLRGIRNDVVKQFRPIQKDFIWDFCEPLKRKILTAAVLRGRIDLSGYLEDPRPYWRGQWTPPGVENVDPLREVNANVQETQALLRSPQDIMAGFGRDPETVLDQIAEFKRMAEKRGLKVQEVTTSMKQNPAELMKDGVPEDAEDEAEDEKTIPVEGDDEN